MFFQEFERRIPSCISNAWSCILKRCIQLCIRIKRLRGRVHGWTACQDASLSLPSNLILAYRNSRAWDEFAYLIDCLSSRDVGIASRYILLQQKKISNPCRCKPWKRNTWEKRHLVDLVVNSYRSSIQRNRTWRHMRIMALLSLCQAEKCTAA